MPITVYTGPMYSSKSEQLIIEYKRFCTRNSSESILAIKPSTDTRNPNVIHSRTFLETIPAVQFGCSDAVRQHIESQDKPLDVLLVDELQFFNKDIVALIQELSDQGTKVYIACLDMTFEANPFPTSARILAIADKIVKLTAFCNVQSCGKKATRTFKKQIIEGEGVVDIGDGDKYEARCIKCWCRGMNRKVPTHKKRSWVNATCQTENKTPERI